MIVAVDYLVQEPIFEFTLRALFQSPEGLRTSEVNITAITHGLESFLVQSGVPKTIKPDDPVDLGIKIANHGLIERQFVVEITNNPCDLDVTRRSTVTVDAKETVEHTISVAGPNDRIWYFSEDCSMTVTVSRADEPGRQQASLLLLRVNGGYIDPAWVMWTVAIIAAVVLVFLLAKRQKEKVEEELLGKPQKPWEIPAEKVYLTHLKTKDERAWYVVRKFVMEDEYASALLWYKSYKHATKGERKKERLVLKQEHELEKWEKGWQKKLQKPAAKADRFEARLEKKLARKTRRDHRKAVRKWRKEARSLEKAHAKQEERALEKWQKKAAKAERKGRDVPPRPEFPEPDYAPQPEREEPVLAEHKWQRKADRFRGRMERKKERLEAKYARQHQRRLRKVRRKVRRVARKIDDPDFAAEHPLLQDQSAS